MKLVDYNQSIPKDAVGHTLIELAGKDETIIVLSSDVSVSCNVEIFKDKYPNRFFEMGIAEQSTMSVAGGLATEGYTPVYVALAIFSCGMTFPQLRQVCNSNLNVKVIGTHAGVDDGQDGSGHHATEDIAISRSIPRLKVLTPSDENEVKAAICAMASMDGPVYMRIARESQPIIHKPDCLFEIGKAEMIDDQGDRFAIIYEGSALKQALEAYSILAEKGVKGKLLSIRSIKPIDRECLVSVASRVQKIVTVENHSIIGGLYSSVVEILAQTEYKTSITPIGFADIFMESGSSADIKIKYGLSAERIVEAIMKED